MVFNTEFGGKHFETFLGLYQIMIYLALTILKKMSKKGVFSSEKTAKWISKNVMEKNRPLMCYLCFCLIFFGVPYFGDCFYQKQKVIIPGYNAVMLTNQKEMKYQTVL